ncbi:MAG TPA: hypothetical protein VFY93_11010 [Planctomycetota bacterium]|nr:hypothetical protein [Planctomycetota bacterium]
MPRKQATAGSARKATAKKPPPAKGKAKQALPKPPPPKALKAVAKAPAKVAKAPPAPPAGKAAGKTAAKPPEKPVTGAAAILAAKAKVKKARAAKKPATPKAPPRLKIVWAVCDHTLKTLKTFPYPERRAAELEAERLQKAKGKEHIVRAERVPMTEARA